MRSRWMLGALVLGGAGAAGACGGGGHAPVVAATESVGTCTPGSAGVVDETTMPAALDAFCQVSVEDAAIVPMAPAVVRYDLNTPLFSDYAVKVRTVWLPPGASARYAADGVLDFPVGTVITKSFGWPADFRDTKGPVRWAETRVLVHTPANGWTGAAYEWDDAQKKASLVDGGDVLRFSFVSSRDTTESPTYLIPSQAQCFKCHASEETFTPLGPTAAQLNRVRGGAYPATHAPAGGENQLAAWSRLGILSGAPRPAEAPALPVWDDPSTGTVDQRARAYLQANCAFCHDGGGEARTTGLVLLDSETAPAKFGVCKAPIAAGEAAGNDAYDVVPGRPDSSILIRRVTSTKPGIAMPELERSLVHVEGVELLTDWVKGLSGGCR